MCVLVAPLLAHHAQVLHYVQHVQLGSINQDHHAFHKLIKQVVTNIAAALNAQLWQVVSIEQVGHFQGLVLLPW